jgi:exodeoxyribonuclease V alpha subunit
MKLDTTQEQAIERAVKARFLAITGGAGTGKTTIIDSITRELERNGAEVKLCAFAGKAAARMREATKHESSTIHRMLGYDGTNFNCESLAGKSIIVDEASMIDSALLSEIVRRGPERLIMVGDQAQLPPVGSGQPFHDIIRHRPDKVANLVRCYRATEAVFKAATTIRSGGRPAMYDESEGERWAVLNTGDAGRTQTTILKWVEEGAFDFARDVILVARNGENPEEPSTVAGLNKAISKLIAPRDEKRKFVIGDRVINTKNLPKLDAWNGTTGTVHANDIDGGVWVRTDIPVIDWDKTSDPKSPKYHDVILFNKENRKHLELAYALTVHKSQGSQYRRVCLVCLRRDTRSLLDRSLLYTGVTRTRESCCLVGEVAAMYQAIDKVDEKRTIIQQLARNS